jgi:hypothetical protein
MPASEREAYDHRHLHAEADAEYGNLALAGIAPRLDLALRRRAARAARLQDAVDAHQELRRVPRRAEDLSRSSRAFSLTRLAMPPWWSASMSDL